MHEDEPAIDPARPIIDPHIHLWEILPAPRLPQAPHRFLLPELLATVAVSGHRVSHSVFVECHQMYRREGAAALRCVGETEFANGIAAMSASGRYGALRVAHRIVGAADLTLGDRVATVLAAHAAAAGDRFRGVRLNAAWRASGLFGMRCDPALRDRLRDPAVIAAARVLAAMGLSLDIWCLQAQLPDVAALADAVPDLCIVLDHAGTPTHRGDPAAVADWRAKIAALAERPNVRIKLGGLGMDLDRAIPATPARTPGAELATRWRPFVEPGIAAFGPARAMFESNFPPDQAAGGYGAIWNAFKRITRAFTSAEQARLFAGTAAEVYRIG